MSNSDVKSDNSPHEYPSSELNAAVLRDRLRALLGDDASADVNLELPTQSDRGDARTRHNVRTASYKLDQALRLVPDSEAVRHATSIVLLNLLLTQGVNTDKIVVRVIKELAEAGYDEEQSRAVLDRLLQKHEDLRQAWRRRTRQKLGRALIERLKNYMK